jgi:hypothetical protein
VSYEIEMGNLPYLNELMNSTALVPKPRYSSVADVLSDILINISFSSPQLAISDSR